MYLKKSRLRRILLGIFILFSIVIIVLFNVEKKYKIKKHLEGQSQLFNSIYQATYKSYHSLADTVYDSLLNKPSIINILNQAQDPKFEDEARKKLYQILYTDFMILEKQYIRQIQFHLPSHKSFLRMHQPKRYGDNLGKIRKSIVYVEKEHKPVDSFEQGKFSNAFRFVYPLFKDKVYIGSVELSFSTLGILTKIMQDYDALSNILIKKHLTDSFLIEGQESYIESPLKDFYFEKSVINTLGNNFNPPQNIDEMRLKVGKQIKEEKLFSVYNRFQDRVITFIPIKHTLSNELLAYILLNSHSDYIYNKILFSQILMFLSIVLLGMVLFFIYREIISRNKLEISEKKSRTILNATASILILWDKQKVVEVNETFFKFFDMYESVDAFNAKYTNFCAVFHPLEEEKFISCALDKNETWFNMIVDNQDETFKTAINKNGKLYYFILNIKSTVISEQQMYLIELTDISNEMSLRIELKKKDIQLFHKHKMAQMGEMINTIAHQWRQPLAIINTIVAISKEKLLLNRLNTEELQNKLQDIEANTTYMSNTIEDFLQFHKPTKDKELFSINEMLKSVLNIMNPSLQASQIITDLNFENNISILGFQRELSQVILALIANARDALVYKDIKSPWIKINAKSDGEYILITIEDNAGGIDENMLLKVFEPYFSTKENKQGSGLGLYISKMIIESSMSGNIDIVNTKNGAKFRIKVKK